MCAMRCDGADLEQKLRTELARRNFSFVGKENRQYGTEFRYEVPGDTPGFRVSSYYDENVSGGVGLLHVGFEVSLLKEIQQDDARYFFPADNAVERLGAYAMVTIAPQSGYKHNPWVVAKSYTIHVHRNADAERIARVTAEFIKGVSDVVRAQRGLFANLHTRGTDVKL